jgi:uncharacterized protein YdhG (YjbR/CyaY superfamily)
MKTEYLSIEEYLNAFPPPIRKILAEIRGLIIATAPGATESISYGMPAYKTNGKPLVYFAGFKKHIGFYATPTAHNRFTEELSGYKQGKGSVQFPLDKPIPFKLIKQMVEYKVIENSLTMKI